MILFTTILFILSVSLSEYFRFLEKRFREGQDVPFLPYDRLWHGFKGLYQACFITLVGYNTDVRYALLGAVLFWITHDIFTNLGLGVKWNCLGPNGSVGAKQHYQASTSSWRTFTTF